MRILTKNELEYASSLSMTNPTSTYPVDNIISLFKEKIAKSSLGVTTITAVWDSPVAINAIFFGYHNIEIAQIRFYDSLSTLLETVNLTALQQDDAVYFNSILYDVSSCQIDLTSVTETFVGSISMGLYTQIVKLRAGYSVTYSDTSTFLQSPGGQTSQFKGTILKSFELILAQLTPEERAAFITAYSAVLKGKSFWLDQYELVAKEIEPPLYGFFEQDIIETRVQSNGTYNITTSFKESR